MGLVSLASLRQQARNRADMRRGGIWTDDDFNADINQNIAELNDLLIKADLYFLTGSVTPIQLGVAQYPFPDDCYKLIGVDYQVASGTPWLTLKQYEMAQRNRLANTTYAGSSCGTNTRYALYGANINLAPVPPGGNLNVLYVPTPAPLVNDTDTYNFIAGFENLVILSTVIHALSAEESDTTAFERQKAEMKDRIEQMAPNRNQGEPHSVVMIDEPDDWCF